MYHKETDSTGIKSVKAVHAGKGSIQIREFFVDTSQLATFFHVWKLEAGTSEGAHTHRTENPDGALEEIYYFLQGQGHMQIGSEAVPISAGDAVLVPAGVEHGVDNTGSTPLKFVLIFGKPQPEHRASTGEGD